MVLIQLVPLLVMFLTEFFSFYRKERKVLRKVFFALWSMLPISKQQEKMQGFTGST